MYLYIHIFFKIYQVASQQPQLLNRENYQIYGQLLKSLAFTTAKLVTKYTIL